MEDDRGFDFEIIEAGTLALFTPMNESAEAWWKENCELGWMTGPSYVVEHRYAQDIFDGLVEAGYKLFIN